MKAERCPGVVYRDFNLRFPCCRIAGHRGPCATTSDPMYQHASYDGEPREPDVGITRPQR